MKRLALVSALFALTAAAAFADDKLSDDETKKAAAAATAWGCEGGTWEKESEGTGLFELDDAKCKDGKKYDLKFDKDYNLMSLTRD